MTPQRFDAPEEGFDSAVPACGARPPRSLARMLAWLRRCVRAWARRRRTPAEVACLSDHLLRDIGLEPRSAWRETTPSVWDQWRR
ncbi:MAG TPA: DUF1127 domain-containing protein [Alphaproteobacteria bacterium]|nr:DUF1127 domain-containing protein [Alphaproteobacteria bacterium]